MKNICLIHEVSKAIFSYINYVDANESYMQLSNSTNSKKIRGSEEFKKMLTYLSECESINWDGVSPSKLLLKYPHIVFDLCTFAFFKLWIYKLFSQLY